MFECQKGENGGETTERRDWLNNKSVIFLWLGTVSKTGRILSKSGWMEMLFEESEVRVKVKK